MGSFSHPGIPKGKRPRKSPVKRMNLEALREQLADGLVHAGLGIVKKREGGDSHFEIVDGAKDVLVDVVMMPTNEPLRCRLTGCAGGPGTGIWSIPPEGCEVAILIPLGDFDFSPMIVATLSSNKIPDGLEGGGTIIIAVSSGKKVLIHDGTNGDAKELATKKDVDDHGHDLPKLECILTGTPYVAAGPVDVTAKLPDLDLKVKKTTAITGTKVLFAK